MNILFYIGNSPFPYGSAGAARVRTLARGLVEEGADVSVLSSAVLDDRWEDGAGNIKNFSGIRYESF